MNAILPRSLTSIQAAVTAVWRAQPGALMVLGRASGPLPKSGSVRIASVPSSVGVFRVEFWQAAGGETIYFLAVIRMPDHDDPADDAELSLRGARTSDRELRLRLKHASGEADFGREVAAYAGDQAARITHFMIDVMRSEDDSDMRGPHEVFASYLQHAARRDGCVELILQAPGHCLVLQGWGARQVSHVDIITNGPPLTRHRAECADFHRIDVPAPATGSVLVLADNAVNDFVGVNQIFLLTDSDLVSRAVIETQALSPEVSLGQLRHLLPRLTCSSSLEARIRSAIQPQFTGVDTLNTSNRPVRAAIDIAATSGTAGVYLSGWIFDPAGIISEIDYCSGSAVTRLDNDLIRIRRHDVTDAFAKDVLFPTPKSHEAGFAVSIPVIAQAGSPYLRFTFVGGDLAFLPIQVSSMESPDARQALLQSVDLHKPSGSAIIERHLAPFFSRLDPVKLGSVSVVAEGPLSRTHAIVVPLRANIMPRAFLASLLEDGTQEDEQVILVCSSLWTPSDTARLIELLCFYDIDATVAVASVWAGIVGAVLHAATLSDANSFLLIDPNTVGRSNGWRQTLRASQSDATAVCPTVLYEDRSVRFAGGRTILATTRAPFARLSTPFAGLSPTYVQGLEPAEVTAGTMACCLLTRESMPALEQSTRFITPIGQETGLFLELGHSGLRCRWLPEVQVSAPDEDVSDTAAATMVDGWMLRESSKDHTCAS